MFGLVEDNGSVILVWFKGFGRKQNKNIPILQSYLSARMEITELKGRMHSKAKWKILQMFPELRRMAQRSFILL